MIAWRWGEVLALSEHLPGGAQPGRQGGFDRRGRRGGFGRGAAYIGDGANRWPAVHTRDAALLYRLAVESAPAGSYLHPVGDEGIPFREIAETIGSGLGVPAISVTAEQAPEHLSFLAGFAHLDNPTSSALTRELLGWEPTHPGLIADLQEGHYFAQ